MHGNEEKFFPGVSGDYGLVGSILSQDYVSGQRTLESVEGLIAERFRLQYRNIDLLESQRRRIEDSLNSLNCWGYYNPKASMVRSKLESEMVRIELRKADERVLAFRDVGRLEEEKRKLLQDLESDKASVSLAAGVYP